MNRTDLGSWKGKIRKEKEKKKSNPKQEKMCEISLCA